MNAVCECCWVTLKVEGEKRERKQKRRIKERRKKPYIADPS